MGDDDARRCADREWSRTAILARPVVMSAIVVLVANDWLLKAVCPCWLTGKLSDFAGVFLLWVCLWSALPSRPRSMAMIAGCSFLWWKSAWSQPLIDCWNLHGPWEVARIVDATDAMAVVVLLPAWWSTDGRAPAGPRRWVAAMVAVLAMAAMLGSDGGRRRSAPDQTTSRDVWIRNVSPDVITVERLESFVRRTDQPTFIASGLRLPSGESVCAGATWETRCTFWIHYGIQGKARSEQVHYPDEAEPSLGAPMRVRSDLVIEVR